jgi:hypothetical protein
VAAAAVLVAKEVAVRWVVEEVARVVVLVNCVLLVEVDWVKVLLLLLTSVAEALVEVARVEEEVEVLAC